jgi:hypothetical protein
MDIEATTIEQNGDVTGEGGDPARHSSRRDLVTKGAVAAAVAAVAGSALSSRVHAANGGNLIIGANNTGTLTTQLGGGSTFKVVIGTTDGNASLYGTSAGDTSSSYGVRGDNSGTSGAGVYGLATAGAPGVRGESSGTTAGTGVFGVSQVGDGVNGAGTRNDFVASRSGKLRLQAAATPTPTAAGDVGTLARDAAGVLWYCYATNKWQRLGGPAAAGAFHPINPIRAFDSRIAAYPASGLFAPNTSRVISVKDGHDAAGAVTSVDAVPAGATAVAFNVTVTQTTGPNFLSVVPGDAAAFTASTLNWSAAGQSVANGSIVKLDASRQVKVFNGDGTGSTHVLIDVTGYFI